LEGKTISTNTMILVGHAALPQGTAAKGSYDHLALVVEIDKKYGVIVNAECSLVTALADSTVKKLLVGRSLQDGVEVIIEEILSSYYGGARNALIAALKDLNREYRKIKEM
jgi:hypothetical protein